MWNCPKCREWLDDQFDTCWKCAAPELPTKCFNCGGTELAKGRIEMGSDSMLASPTFRPDGLRFLAMTMSHGTPLNMESYACLSCGLVWSQTNAQDLKDHVQKYCKKPE